MKQYDVVIVGFGKGGKTLASFLGKKGWNIAVVEKSKKMYGGTCINVACIPTKYLIHEAKKLQFRQNQEWEEKAKTYASVMATKKEFIDKLRLGNYKKVNQPNVAEVIDGYASFVDEHTLSVEQENGVIQIKAETIIINTGATPVLPDIIGIDNNLVVYTSETLLNEERLPKTLSIIGGGYISLEFASMYADFGSKVRIFDRGDTFLPKEDGNVAKAVRETLEKKGIEIHLQARSKKIEGDQLVIEFTNEGAEKIFQSDAILLATGRKPNTDGLQLEKAGVKTGKRKEIVVDSQLRTSTPHIFAIGDVKGGPQFTYVSLDDYRIVADQLTGGKEYNQEKRGHLPYSVFIDPPLSRIGLTEKEAIDKNLNFDLFTLAAADIPRAKLIGETEGMLQVIVEKDSDEILGAALFCAESYEIINLIKYNMDTRDTYHTLKNQIYTHPSMTESLNYLFDELV
ncbi:FAD-dependent oxidoreductase [Peribacillus loiseleuriae]|uniref:FAD-dependent oxidoreductase n=1 Tax=Peribacillus loiseleuriae TaxID=1679170 RepID=UPI003D082198